RKLRPWLFRIEHNLYVSWVRRRENEHSYQHFNDVSEIPDTSSGIEFSAEVRAIQRALAQLPAVQRAVILLISVEGFSYEEASKVLSVPVGTVRSRLSRGRETLRALITR
ncbi:MAG: RNA polymerase sigma factor, partial [Natronospirillum sp.]